MIDKRSLVMGIGIGMIVGALLMQLFSIGENSQRKLDQIDKELSGQEEEPLASPMASPSPQSEESGVPEEEPETTEVPGETETSDEQHEESADLGQDAEEERFMVRIEPGYNLTQAARLLAGRQVIENESEFITEMNRTGKQVRAGYFLFTSYMDVQEVAVIVSSQPLSEEEAKSWMPDGAE